MVTSWNLPRKDDIPPRTQSQSNVAPSAPQVRNKAHHHTNPASLQQQIPPQTLLVNGTQHNCVGARRSVPHPRPHIQNTQTPLGVIFPRSPHIVSSFATCAKICLHAHKQKDRALAEGPLASQFCLTPKPPSHRCTASHPRVRVPSSNLNERLAAIGSSSASAHSTTVLFRWTCLFRLCTPRLPAPRLHRTHGGGGRLRN